MDPFRAAASDYNTPHRNKKSFTAEPIKANHSLVLDQAKMQMLFVSLTCLPVCRLTALPVCELCNADHVPARKVLDRYCVMFVLVFAVVGHIPGGSAMCGSRKFLIFAASIAAKSACVFTCHERAAHEDS